MPPTDEADPEEANGNEPNDEFKESSKEGFPQVNSGTNIESLAFNLGGDEGGETHDGADYGGSGPAADPEEENGNEPNDESKESQKEGFPQVNSVTNIESLAFNLGGAEGGGKGADYGGSGPEADPEEENGNEHTPEPDIPDCEDPLDWAHKLGDALPSLVDESIPRARFTDVLPNGILIYHDEESLHDFDRNPRQLFPS